MNAFMIPLGEMVGRAELEDYFRETPEEVLVYIELLGGSDRDVRLAPILPFPGRIAILWDLIQARLKDAGK